MQNSKTELMLIAIIPKDLKDDAVDTLMSTAFITGFSLFPINGFSQEHSQFNIREQVEGYRAYFRFEVAHLSENTDALLATLGTVSTNGNIRYWITPIHQSGYL